MRAHVLELISHACQLRIYSPVIQPGKYIKETRGYIHPRTNITEPYPPAQEYYKPPPPRTEENADATMTFTPLNPPFHLPQQQQQQ